MDVQGFRQGSVVADASASDSDGNMIFVATREFTERDDASFGSGSSSEDGTGESPVKDASSSGLPQTEMPWARRLVSCLSHRQWRYCSLAVNFVDGGWRHRAFV